jgi:hypothetical protein
MMPPALYQVVLIGAGRVTHRSGLTDAVKQRLAEIGDDLAAALRIIEPPDIGTIVLNAPIVAVYFGNDPAVDQMEVQKLVADAVPVLPVVDDLDGYTAKTPATLHPINGLAIGWSAPDYTELANLILENLELLRRSRRLFLSYFRKESTPIAHQLRVAFDDAGYDTFLDTSSVPKGDDFQSVLWHRLLDSDVLVVLDTPNFLSSRWTRDELAQAAAMSVGMLRVVWPDVAREPKAELAVHLYLDVSDFESEDHLTKAAVTRIMTGAEALRARCIAARHTNLVVEFCQEANRSGATTTVQPGRYVLAEMRDGRKIAAIPAVGVLDARRYHEASSRFPTSGGNADEAVLIYDHRGMMTEWREFLDWLDNYLPVRGLRVTETAAKLGRAP